MRLTDPLAFTLFSHEMSVHMSRMLRNITFSEEERLLEAARRKAARERHSLNEVFREWLGRYAGRDDATERFDRLMTRLRYVRSGRKFTRTEMNER
jgi:hypothetical protein